MTLVRRNRRRRIQARTPHKCTSKLLQLSAAQPRSYTTEYHFDSPALVSGLMVLLYSAALLFVVGLSISLIPSSRAAAAVAAAFTIPFILIYIALSRLPLLSGGIPSSSPPPIFFTGLCSFVKFSPSLPASDTTCETATRRRLLSKLPRAIRSIFACPAGGPRLPSHVYSCPTTADRPQTNLAAAPLAPTDVVTELPHRPPSFPVADEKETLRRYYDATRAVQRFQAARFGAQQSSYGFDSALDSMTKKERYQRACEAREVATARVDRSVLVQPHSIGGGSVPACPSATKLAGGFMSALAVAVGNGKLG
ncbi:hypothetical protein K488DRAFT_90192 [Vararia minispora EC-137]|uniref:Uncharacterized protein n=1 Tax=Vararia minispora EC-137 TaxID=1314806 RepID=A0ACB8Q914_9AGAM|nr:hypothetical protein K488DRAFT_90192 [Vararia minispora EC-137]